MKFEVVFTPEAEENLVDLYNYIASVTAPDTAEAYTEAIVAHCENLNAFPARGSLREDIRPGLRITNYKKRTIIAFAVDEGEARVSVLGIYYGGQDYAVILSNTP